MPDGTIIEENIKSGIIKKIPLTEDEKVEIQLKPVRGFDVGAGSGRQVNTIITGGVEGVIIDTRGRPLRLPEDDIQRRNKLLEWIKILEVYPKQVFELDKR